jgi:NADP-dependent 3-hydroxy acid dehydrogenase YdfG/acyl carrier protein/SAM-dependent methyltransferase
MEQIHHIYFLGGIQTGDPEPETPETLAEAQEAGVLALLRWIRALERSGRLQDGQTLAVITDGVQAVFSGEAVRPAHGALPGLCRVIAKEFRQLDVRCVDLERKEALGKDVPADLESYLAPVFAFLEAPGGGADAAYRCGRFYSRELVPIRLSGSKATGAGFRKGGVYLIAGGAGGIGLALSRYLSERYGAVVILLGRSRLSGDKRAEIERIGSLGGTIEYVRVDITDPEKMASVVSGVKARHGRINGAIHSAIVLKDRAIYNMDEETFQAVLSPKVQGSLALYRALSAEALDFLLFFSSVQSFTGNAGQSNYAAACTFKDAYALYLNRICDFPVRVINWGYWGSIGVVSGEAYRKRSASQGVLSIEPEEGMAVIEAVLAGRLPQVVPFKAETDLLEKMGLSRNDVFESLPESSTSDPVIDFPEAEPAVENQDAADRSAGAEEALAFLARHLLLRAFQSMGVFSAPGSEGPVSELNAKLSLLPKYRRLTAAMLKILKSAGWIEIDDGRVAGADALASPELGRDLDSLASRKPAIVEAFPEIAAHVELLWTCGERYPEILTGRVPATDVIFPGGSQHLVEGIYRNNAGAEYFNGHVARYIARCMEARFAGDIGGADRAEKFRIIEIGAGTGGTTASVLEAIQEYGNRLVYTYTDISGGFVRHGKRAFTDHGFMEFGILDIEREVKSQGFEIGFHDLAIATNVLHATRNVRDALRHAKMLLKSGGLLILNETTAVNDFSTLTYGLLDGWWRYEDEADRLPGSPLLSTTLWREVLATEGYENIRCLIPPPATGDFQPQNVLTAQSDGWVRGSNRIEPTPQPEEERKKEIPENKDSVPAYPESAGLPVSAVLVETISQVLEMDKRELSLDTPYTDIGVDSILALEIVNRIREKLDIPLRSTDLFNYPSIRKLSDHITATCGESIPVKPVEAAGKDASAGDGSPEDETDRFILRLVEAMKRGELTADDAALRIIKGME